MAQAPCSQIIKSAQAQAQHVLEENGMITCTNCVKPERARDSMRPMGFADIQELFDVTLTEDAEGAERLIQLVRMIEKFHGIG